MQGVAQQLFGSGPERIQVPAGFENLCELGKLHIALLALLRFQYVQPDREFGVARFDDDELFTEVNAPLALLGRNEP